MEKRLLGMGSMAREEGGAGRRSAAAPGRGRGWRRGRLGVAVPLAAAVAGLAVPTVAVAADCPDVPIRPAFGASYPAGCLVYEKVSPADKGNGEVAGGAVMVTGFRASESGDHVIYPADSVFLGAPTFPQVNPYYAYRSGDSWVNSSLTAQLPVRLSPDVLAPPEENPDGELPQGISANGRWTVLGANLVPGTREQVLNRGYALNMQDQRPERITPPTLDGDHPVSMEGGYISSAVVVGDNERTIFTSSSRLTEDSMPLSGEFDPRLYSTENGQTKLVSRLPNGEAANGTLADAMWDASQSMRRWPVAADGKTVWWNTSGTDQRIYRGNVDEPRSSFVNAAENADDDVPEGGAMAVSADVAGTRMSFVSGQPLMTGMSVEPEDQADRFFLYTHSDDPEDDQNLRLISTDSEPADTSRLSVIAKTAQMSDDGRTAYFWTTEKQLVAGGPIGPGEKLYRWHDGQLSYLATATVPTDGVSLTAADGRFYTFDSDTSDLTDKPTGGQIQRYVYDAQTERISCVSCPEPGATTAIGGVGLTPPMNLMQMDSSERRYLSTDGQVIFATATQLVADDTNGRIDVYAWKDGKARLVSSGRATSDVRFADASVDGSTIFFSTRDRLSAWDTDTRADLYVARRGGGLPEPNERPVEACSGDACQGDPGPAVLPPTLGSVSFGGAGDVPAVPWKLAAGKTSVAKLKTITGTSATLRVTVPAKGAVRVSGDGVASARKATKRAQTVRVPVRLSAAAKKRLTRTGKLAVRVSVRFQPTSGAAQTVRLRVTFKKAKGSSKSASSRVADAKGGR